MIEERTNQRGIELAKVELRRLDVPRAAAKRTSNRIVSR
jgi:hypothetical protein